MEGYIGGYILRNTFYGDFACVLTEKQEVKPASSIATV